MYQEAVDLSRRARHVDGLAQALRMRGEVLFTIGRDEEALGQLAEAAQLFAQIEDREAEASLRRQVALILERRAHPDAVAAWQRVRALAVDAGDTDGELAALEGIARATRTQAGGAEAAIGRFEEALTLAARLGEHRREASLRNTLGILEWERGAYAAALAHYEAALGLLRALGERAHEGLILNSIGVTLQRMHRYDEARTVLEDALAVNRETGQRLLEGHSLKALANVARARDHHPTKE
jgi:tetratricopeptide (TPR) repeat protein